MQEQAQNVFIRISIHKGQVFPCFNNITWLAFHSWRTTSAFPLSVVFNLAEAFLVIWRPVTSTQSKICYKQESGETCSCACRRQNYVTACLQISKHYSSVVFTHFQTGEAFPFLVYINSKRSGLLGLKSDELCQQADWAG